MELQGTIQFINETQSFGAKGFKKRTFILKTNEDYPQTLEIEVVQDKCALLDHFHEGQSVTIGINLRGREWTDKSGNVKYFNTIQCWAMKSNE